MSKPAKVAIRTDPGSLFVADHDRKELLKALKHLADSYRYPCQRVPSVSDQSRLACEDDELRAPDEFCQTCYAAWVLRRIG